jgi:pterin-4a-carbinolamine dehydratase
MSSTKKQTSVRKDLKAERVQEDLTASGTAMKAPVAAAAVQERLKAERVQERLLRMPGWGLALDGTALDRVRELRTAEDAAEYAGLALRMASRARFPAQVQVEGKRVLLTLQGHPNFGARGGITDNLLDFATSLG